MLRFTTVITGQPGSPGYSTMYTGGTTEGEADIGGNHIGTFWDALKGFMITGSQINIIGDVDLVDPLTGQTTAVFSNEVNTVNTTGSAAQSGALQGLIRWRTGDFVNGREIRGRTFIPWLAAASVTGGVPSGAFTTALAAAGNTLVTNLSAAGEMCVYSPTHRQFADVTAVSVWTKLAVLRSRRD